jgi:hypothetical protein
VYGTDLSLAAQAHELPAVVLVIPHAAISETYWNPWKLRGISDLRLSAWAVENVFDAGLRLGECWIAPAV